VQRLKVLVTVKTYPIPSATYDELSCTAGVTETGDFVRLYPINYRDLPWEQQFKNYQWIEVLAKKHHRSDFRKESWRPHSDSVELLGEPIGTGPRGGDWSQRGKYVLKNVAASLEELRDRQEADNTSLGIFRPREVTDLVVTPDDAEWKRSFLDALRQTRMWDTRKASRIPLRKVPWRFQYRFRCDDSRCKGHKLTNEDWEVGALYWKLVDQGATPEEATRKVKQKFLDEICSPERETYFYVGTILKHPRSWLVIGTFYPKRGKSGNRVGTTGELFSR